MREITGHLSVKRATGETPGISLPFRRHASIFPSKGRVDAFALSRRVYFLIIKRIDKHRASMAQSIIANTYQAYPGVRARRYMWRARINSPLRRRNAAERRSSSFGGCRDAEVTRHARRGVASRRTVKQLHLLPPPVAGVSSPPDKRVPAKKTAGRARSGINLDPR